MHITNAGAPHWWQKKTGQIHLQTWHGTPLKRIGEDRGPGDFATWRHRRRMALQAAGWDAMISPSPFCSEHFRSAFRFDGRFLEVGYPRNDVLLDPTRSDVVRTPGACPARAGRRATAPCSTPRPGGSTSGCATPSRSTSMHRP